MTYPDGTTQAFGYDPLGNRQTKTQLGAPSTLNYLYDSGDRLQAISDTAGNPALLSYTYDSNGNQTGRSNARLSDSFQFDLQDRLKAATVRGTSVAYQYRPDGLRHSKQVGTDPTTSYVWDVGSGLPVVLQDGTNLYLYGLGLISQTSSSTNQPTYFLADGLGSTAALANSSGTVTSTYRYDVFGALRNPTGTPATEYLYTGQQYDASLGYYYLRARYYDQSVGRFVGRDQYRGSTDNPLSLNGFAYGLDSPTNWVDPSGRIVWVPALVLIGAGVGAVGNTINYAINTRGDLSLGGAAEAFAKGAVAGGAGSAAAVAVGVGAAAVGMSGLGVAAMSGAASGFVGNSVGNRLYGRPLFENWFQATAIGAVMGPLARDKSPTVGFKPGLSMTRGHWSPRGGYAGANTKAVYWQEAGFDVGSQYAGIFTMPPSKK